MSANDLWLAAGLSGAVFLGASTQRISGVGFALVASPFLVALLGPFNGIIVINVFGVLTALTVFVHVHRLVEYKRAFLMMIPAIVAIIPGSWVAKHMPSDLLSILIGAMIIVALLASLFVHDVRILAGRAGAVFAGAVSGFMSVTAGVGGPAVTAYAVATRWPQATFAATAQLYFFCVGTASLLAKQTFPQMSPVQWAGCAIALAVGVLVGNLSAPLVPHRVSRVAVIVIAFVGSLLILTKGILALVGGA